jgi:hypothetical protein
MIKTFVRRVSAISRLPQGLNAALRIGWIPCFEKARMFHLGKNILGGLEGKALQWIGVQMHVENAERENILRACEILLRKARPVRYIIRN